MADSQNPTSSSTPEHEHVEAQNGLGNVLDFLMSDLDNNPDLIKECYDKKVGESFTVERSLEVKNIARALPSYFIGGFITDGNGDRYRVVRAFERTTKPQKKNVPGTTPDSDTQQQEVSTEPWSTIYPDEMIITKIGPTGQETQVTHEEITLGSPLTITNGFSLWNLPEEEKKRLAVDTKVASEVHNIASKSRKKLKANLESNQAMKDMKKNFQDLIGFLKLFGFQNNFNPPIKLALSHNTIESSLQSGVKTAWEKHKDLKVAIKPTEVKDNQNNNQNNVIDKSNMDLLVSASKLMKNPKYNKDIKERSYHSADGTQKKAVTVEGRQSEVLEFVPFSENVLLYPIATSDKKITLASSFGVGTHPIHGDKRFHMGCDCHSTGDIMALRDGKVKSVQQLQGYGTTITIDYGGGVESMFAHVNRKTVKIKQGDQVKQGEVVAHTGSEGIGTGEHLHLEMRVNNELVDPTLFAYTSTPDSKTFLAARATKEKAQYAKNTKNPQIAA